MHKQTPLNKFFSLFTTPQNYYYVGRTPDANHVDAVVILSLDRDTDEMIVLKEFRPAIGDFIYSLPAGLIDKGETPVEAAKRELFEETGLIFDTENVSILNNIFPCSGLTNEKHVLIGGDSYGELTNINNESDELITPMRISPEELIDLVDNDKVNIDTYLAMIYVFTKGEL